MEKNLTNGSVLKNIAYFSLPYLLSYFLQTLYGLADLFIIGQFEGVASTTAVSIGSQVMHMLTVMIVGLAMGSTVCIGQAVGAGDKKHASAAIGNTVTLFMLLSVVITALLLALVRPIVSVMSTPAEAADGTQAYLTICFIGIPFITAYNIISSIFRGLGDSKSPMIFIAVACAANIALDYIFIGAMGLGPAGAALGTTLSQAISVVFSLVVILRRKSGISLERRDLHPQRDTMGRLLRIGVPVAAQDGLIQIAFIVITVIANRRGLDAAAAVGIVEKIISFVFLVPSSMLSTVSALCAQNIGAGKQARAEQTLRYAVIIAVSFGIIIALLWYSYWHFFFIHGMGPSFFNWEPDELPIITLYAGYIPMFISVMAHSKGSKPLMRYILPVVAILGCCFMVYCAFVAYGIQALYYLGFFALVMAVGALVRITQSRQKSKPE